MLCFFGLLAVFGSVGPDSNILWGRKMVAGECAVSRYAIGVCQD
jgi:hypothetical protein